MSNNFCLVWCLNYSQSVDFGYLAKCFSSLIWGMKLNWKARCWVLSFHTFATIVRKVYTKIEHNLAEKSLKTLNTITRFSEQFQTSYLTREYFCYLSSVFRLWLFQLSNFTEIIWPRIFKQTLYSLPCLPIVYMAERIFSYLNPFLAKKLFYILREMVYKLFGGKNFQYDS